jgi:ectoine hydroxylase-related dioxygenase (phytanoyl-CoA dioxygenase family)
MGLEINIDRVAEIGLGRSTGSGRLSAALDEDGFVVVPALLSDAELEVLTSEFERLVADDPDARRHELGTRRTHVGNENAVFALCWRHRAVLDAAAHVLGPNFEVGGVDLRDPNPGYGQQRHHPDHGDVPVPGITATWYLDAFTEDNGATRVLPGSHRSAAPWGSKGEAPDADTPIPGEVVAVGPAGSVLLRDARLFHAAGRNRTRRPRRSALVFYQHDIPNDVVGRA